MFLEIGRKRFQVTSLEEASRMFCAARDKMGEGASRTPSPKIVDERGEVIAHVSYNGRVWAGASYIPDAKPLYDNRTEAVPSLGQWPNFMLPPVICSSCLPRSPSGQQDDGEHSRHAENDGGDPGNFDVGNPS